MLNFSLDNRLCSLELAVQAFSSYDYKATLEADIVISFCSPNILKRPLFKPHFIIDKDQEEAS